MIENLKILIRGSMNLKKLKKNGLIIGKNFNYQPGVIIDPSHCWLINIGDNVTLAPNVHILAHDASTKIFTNYVIIKKVVIGNNVFIGANTIILPGVNIGNDVIIGAGSVVTKNIPSGEVWAGNPAKKLCDLKDYLKRKCDLMNCSTKYDDSYRLGNITNEKK